MTSGSVDDVRLLGCQVSFDSVAEEFLVTIGAEYLSKATSFYSKEIKCFNNLRNCESFESKHPVVASGAIDKHKHILETTDEDGIPKTDVDVDFVEILILRTLDGISMRGLVDRCTCAKALGEFACADPFPIASNLQKLLIILESATSGNTMELLGRP